MTNLLILLFTFISSSVNACYYYSLHPNGETSISLKDTGHDREQITRATIGEGVIEVGGKVADDAELAGLNRDTTKAQEITKDMTTGVLDSTVTIDNRVFTEEGRNSIAKDHKKAVRVIPNLFRNLLLVPLSFPKILK